MQGNKGSGKIEEAYFIVRMRLIRELTSHPTMQRSVKYFEFFYTANRVFRFA